MGILGVDVGGAFTDGVLIDDGRVSTAKVPAQEESVLAADLLHLRRQARAHL